MISLISLSENDKRLIIVLIIIFILIFIIFGYLGLLIKKIMRFQGERIDREVHDPVVCNVINTPKHFRRFALKKNMRLLFKESWIPVLVLFCVVGLYFIYSMAIGHLLDLTDYKQEGFSTILFLWSFSDPTCYKEFFGVTLLAQWPDTFHTPEFHIEALVSYIVVPGLIVGAIWFLVDVQAYIARTYRIFKLSRSIYKKSLENYDAASKTFIIPNSAQTPAPTPSPVQRNNDGTNHQ